MTVLTASQDAIARLVGRRPSAVFASQEEICVEIASLSNEAATDIMKSYDWRKLTQTHEITGNGSATVFPLPDGYDRMVAASDVQNPANYFWGYQPVPTVNDWNWLKANEWNTFPGAWIILGDGFNFYPAPSSGQKATFPFISENYAVSLDGDPKPAFTRDDDSFVLRERLLTLALIWRWKALKLMDYQEDMRNYEVALSQEQTRDPGARVIRKGGFRDSSGVNRSPFGPWY